MLMRFLWITPAPGIMLPNTMSAAKALGIGAIVLLILVAISIASTNIFLYFLLCSIATPFLCVIVAIVGLSKWLATKFGYKS